MFLISILLLKDFVLDLPNNNEQNDFFQNA